MKEGIKTAWAILWSIPLAVVMLVMLLIMWIGWGTEVVDRFMKVYHEEFIDDDESGEAVVPVDTNSDPVGGSGSDVYDRVREVDRMGK